ncbi:unnamed protein product [Pleuronectes platessa]|uniref:Uncharacterized protein n=1 Tax=Pleuronectes platessa TaxID=8262 RepID=A0A9N7U136_PLEPL|nr:unnamed protein product [Pleuronectes platessa]
MSSLFVLFYLSIPRKTDDPDGFEPLTSPTESMGERGAENPSVHVLDTRTLFFRCYVFDRVCTLQLQPPQCTQHNTPHPHMVQEDNSTQTRQLARGGRGEPRVSVTPAASIHATVRSSDQKDVTGCRGSSHPTRESWWSSSEDDPKPA